MSAYTPGPWTDKSPDESQWGVYTANAESTPIAQAQQLVGDDIKQNKRTANARLISAAPDLLEALIRCQNSLQRMLEQHGSPWEADHLASKDSIAAIAKAEGRTE